MGVWEPTVELISDEGTSISINGIEGGGRVGSKEKADVHRFKK